MKMKMGLRRKHYARGKKMKTAVIKWLKGQSTEIYEAGIYGLIRRLNIAVKRKVTMLRTKDLILRGPTSF